MKEDRKIIFQGMPSLVSKMSLEFDSGWPKSLILPNPFPTRKGKKTTQTEQIKKYMQITDCQHYFRKHYAKNLCKNCYIKIGKGRPAYNCEHTNRAHYAMGVCQLCYLKLYNQKKTGKISCSEV